jgi:hypothetical protein
MALWRLLLVLFALVALVAGQAGDEQAAPVEEQQAAAPEQVGAEAFRFEEVWNLFKPEQGGWLLAGIQQIPVTQAS